MLKKEYKERPSIDEILNYSYIRYKMEELGIKSNSFTIRISSFKNKNIFEDVKDDNPD